MRSTEFEESIEPRIYGVKISKDGDKCYCISVRHTGQFSLKDYKELDFEVRSVKLIRKKPTYP